MDREIGKVHSLNIMNGPSKTYTSERNLNVDAIDCNNMPDLLDLDVQNMYKNDGLQFDECWQDRMLDRYLLMKLQREQRQVACINKRAMLMQDRRYKIISHRPELLYSDTSAWYKEHDHHSDYILNSPLLTGNREKVEENPCPRSKSQASNSTMSTFRVETQSWCGRHSSMDGSNQACGRHEKQAFDNYVSDTESSKKFRFSAHCPTDHDSRYSIDGGSCYNLLPPATQLSSQTTRQPVGSKSVQKFLLKRPRSSSSIPGKTRYVLVKPEVKNMKSRMIPTPTKLEDDLMKRRFPMQHQTLMRLLHKFNDTSEEAYDDCADHTSTNSRNNSHLQNTNNVGIQSQLSLHQRVNNENLHRTCSLPEKQTAFVATKCSFNTANIKV